MTTQKQGVWATSTCVCAKDILEKKWDKLCEMKEEIRKVVVGSDFFLKKQQESH